VTSSATGSAPGCRKARCACSSPGREVGVAVRRNGGTGNWLLENLLVLVAVPLLVVTTGAAFSNFAYGCPVLFLVLHEVGAHQHLQRGAWRDWLAALTGGRRGPGRPATTTTRVHFAYGLLIMPAVRGAHGGAHARAGPCDLADAGAVRDVPSVIYELWSGSPPWCSVATSAWPTSAPRATMERPEGHGARRSRAVCGLLLTVAARRRDRKRVTSFQRTVPTAACTFRRARSFAQIMNVPMSLRWQGNSVSGGGERSPWRTVPRARGPAAQHELRAREVVGPRCTSGSQASSMMSTELRIMGSGSSGCA